MESYTFPSRLAHLRLSPTRVASIDTTGYGITAAECQKNLIITRIFTPCEFRRRGHAKRLLLRLIVWARLNCINLWLEIQPYGDGGPGYNELLVFYSRYGFREYITGLYKFQP